MGVAIMLESIVQSTKKAFTLTELLVTTAIIGILAAMALPNFIEAHTRAKVSRERSNLYAIATALESYRIDHNQYPAAAIPLSVSGGGITLPSKVQRLLPLTTPIAYISSLPSDIFSPLTAPENVTNYLDRHTYELSGHYANDRPSVRNVDISYFTRGVSEWIAMSFGPARQRPLMTDGFNDDDLYDPTNGTVSLGLLTRIGP